MKLLKDLGVIKRAKKIIKSLPNDLNTQISAYDTEISIQAKKIKQALKKLQKHADKKLLNDYYDDLMELKRALEKYADGVTRLGRAKSYNSILGIIKSMRKKYKKYDKHITELCEGKND